MDSLDVICKASVIWEMINEIKVFITIILLGVLLELLVTKLKFS